MKNIEIEKRFLVPEERVGEFLKLAVEDGVEMEDYYVPNGKAHKDLRLRRKGDSFEITRKQPVAQDDTTVMLETTIRLSEEEFVALAEGIRSKVEKRRYLIDYGEWRGELDVFTGEHAGLAVLEFEFQNEADLADFEETAKIGLTDITNVEWLAGGRLAEIDGEGLRGKLKSIEQLNYTQD